MRKLWQNVQKLISQNKQPLITMSLLGCVVVTFQNCQQSEDFYASAVPQELDDPIEKISEPREPLCANGSTDDLICNPLGGGTGGSAGGAGGGVAAQNGLIGHLYEGQPNWNNIDRYQAEGYKHPENIFFSNFNVPTRAFDEGFGYGPDDYLKNQAGDKLIEWFSISANGFIVLPDIKEEGFYHVATISDDGIRISIDGSVILSNPNVHAPTIDCATELVQFRKGDKKPFVLDYFQGPRYHIALITMIKKVDPANYARSGLCSTRSGPASLIQEGYEVIGPEWFVLPDGF